MRNIFLFIRRYFTFLLFLVLQVLALWMLFTYNRFHHSFGLDAANEITGVINKQVDRLDDYFHQGEENKRVHRMNDSLLNLLQTNFYTPDTGKTAVVDTLRQDSTKSVRRYYWLDAKVVYNTVNLDKNYLQINRGSKYGINENMAVLNSNGAVVGVVVNVSTNFAQVMSLLHVQSSVSAALKKTGETGTVEWDGVSPETVLFKGIPKSVDVKVGDTVATSRYSFNFPPDKTIGTVRRIENDPATGLYILKVKPAVNFKNIQQVFVVENLQRQEQVQLQADTEKKIEHQKQNP